MKGSSSPIVRAMYIILVPIVLLIVLLNSGWLQRLLPAATVHGENYSVVRYNFYYFDYYNTFLDENEERLDELGYVPGVNEKTYNYADGVTWRDYFMSEAEQELIQTAYYCDLAEAAGYQFSEEELAPVQQTLDANDAERISFGIRNKSSYYVSYYGSGMNESRFASELTRKVKAAAYRAYLAQQYTPEQAEIDAWLDEHPEEDYQAAELKVITLDAAVDLVTEEFNDATLNALQEKLDRLVERYENGESFETLQSAFSTCEAGDAGGSLTATTAANLPQGMTDWCLKEQDSLESGETFAFVDAETGIAYFAVLEGLGGSGRELDAEAALSELAMQELEANISDYVVDRNSIGMLIAAT